MSHSALARACWCLRVQLASRTKWIGGALATMHRTRGSARALNDRSNEPSFRIGEDDYLVQGTGDSNKAEIECLTARGCTVAHRHGTWPRPSPSPLARSPNCSSSWQEQVANTKQRQQRADRTQEGFALSHSACDDEAAVGRGSGELRPPGQVAYQATTPTELPTGVGQYNRAS